MSNASGPIRDDHPMKVAWDAYTGTDRYENTVRLLGDPMQSAAGTLWAAFLEGWNGAHGLTGNDPVPDDGPGEVLR